MDPITVTALLGSAAKSYNMVKKAIEMGREASDMVDYFSSFYDKKDQLDAILTNRGGTKDELVLRIATNASQYADVFGKALGKKQKAIADLG